MNSGIRRIGVATQYKAHSLIRHLQRGWNFFRLERNESFDILPASQRVSEEWYRGTRFGPIGDGPDELHKSVLARTILKGYTPVEGWPTEHIPSRRPAAEEKWRELQAAAGAR